MKIAIMSKYGGPEVLKIKNGGKPTPKDNEILIKICAAPVNSGDARLRRADPFPARFITGLFKPKKVLGIHFSGIVEKIGKNVTKFKIADEIFGSAGMGLGTFSEYICLNENSIIIKKPQNKSFEESSTLVFGANTALYFLNKAELKKGEKILINGASGAVGTSAIELSKNFGAVITGVCSESNFKLIKSLGAKFAIDYKREDFTKNNEKYDVIFDTIGNLSFNKCKNSLNEGGRFISTNGKLKDYFKSIFNSKDKKIIVGLAAETIENLETLKELCEKNKLTVVIDSVYDFKDIVKANEKVDSKHKVGNVVLKMI
jgi:NADPH:quinone reductase-like Zn-dependent oxidoreductase